MAVYTDITENELGAFLQEYPVGDLLSYKGIAEGVENTNYLLHTERGPYFLTLYEKRVVPEQLPFFLGLAVVMPVLGHATWHLYRRVVVPDTGPRPEFHPREKGRRYAADFPSSLFAPISRKDEL